MNPDRLFTALHDLVEDAEQGVAPPVADDLWAGGRRRRRATALVPGLAAACIAALVALLVWPTGDPRASVPAVTVNVDGYARLTTYPSTIPKPPFTEQTRHPGVTAAVLADRGDTIRLYAVSPAGVVRELLTPDPDSANPAALSPDGRWLAQGTALRDLVHGETVPTEAVRAELASTHTPPGEAWWSPDSRRAFVAALDQGRPRSSGLVIDTDGSVVETPLLEGNVIPSVAGWLDDSTLLSLLPGDTDLGRTLFEVRTWTVGAPAWTDPGTQIVWAVPEPSPVRASLSPAGDRLLVTASATDPGSDQVTGTHAMMFDPRTGAQLGMPSSGGGLEGTSVEDSVFWFGSGCRPAWRDDETVVTDGEIRGTVVSADETVVDVSSRYDSPCVAFAGNDLRGTPTVDARAVWQERLWVWGGRLLLVAGVAWLVWIFTLRRGWRDGTESPRPFLPFIPSRG